MAKDKSVDKQRGVRRARSASSVTNNPVIGIGAHRSRITERLIECEAPPLATTPTPVCVRTAPQTT